MTSTARTVYILDTNVLINFSIWIPIPLNTTFWTKMEEYLRNGDWVLLDVVANEVKWGELKNWCKQQKSAGLVRAITDDHRNRATEINNTYPMIDSTSQKSTVDTFLVAYAEDNGLTVFTREGSRVSQAGLHKIPEVCTALGLNCIKDPHSFLTAIGFSN